MTSGRRYLIGLVVVTAIGAAMVARTNGPVRLQVAWGVVVGLVVQAPLGWWAIRSVGTDRFMMIWGLGLLVRLAVLAIAGIAVVPLLGWSPGPALGALVTILVTLLIVEGVTAWQEQEHSGEGGRR